VAWAPWLSVIEVADDWHDPRFRLVNGRWRLVGYHEGNDIMAEEGTPVVALVGGGVERVGWTF
jgi:murein DD-endopeptidase MepM/ murein hydrolase activator NlpD